MVTPQIKAQSDNRKADVSGTPLLRLEKVTKLFPGIRAVDSVSMDLQQSEIHALLGENGAGKSTLIKMIYGVLEPDAGKMLWRGEEMRLSGPTEARALGIGMVFQHFSLFEALTTSENIELALPPPHQGGPVRSDIPDLISDISKKYGLPLDPHKVVHDLSVGERQRIEIVRCLIQQPQLLIMDEPTSVLTPQEAENLFETLRQLSGDGCAILYISHKLQEIKTLCNTATILRRGQVVSTCDPSAESAESLARLMIGEAPSPPERTGGRKTGDVMLELHRFSKPAASSFGISLKDISLTVREGEIVGLAGVAGNGQSELMEALIGEAENDGTRADIKAEGAIFIEGLDATNASPNDRRALGACFVPEERNGHATAPLLSLSENSLLSANKAMSLTSKGWISTEKRDGFTQKIVADFSVKASGINADARSLSGGNLQKFIIGREILQFPSVLIVNQPSWGVDAGSAAAIQKALVSLAQLGAAILVLSQDIDELFTISDRIGVMFDGRLFDPVPVADLTIEKLGLMMGGTP